MPCFIELPAEIHQMIIAHYMPQLPTMGSEAAKGHGEYRDLWSSAAYSIAASCTEMLSATSEFMLRRCLEAGRELDIAKRGVYEPRPIAFYRFLIVGCTWSKLHRLSEALAGRALPVATNKVNPAFGLKSCRETRIDLIMVGQSQWLCDSIWTVSSAKQDQRHIIQLGYQQTWTATCVDMRCEEG